MYQAQRTEENPTGESAKVPLIWQVLQVWKEGHIANDETLRAVRFILSGEMFTPSGSRLRESQRAYDAELQSVFTVCDNGAVPTPVEQSGTAPLGGSLGFTEGLC